MSTIEMRRKARRKIQKLSPRDLRTALDFLEARDEEDATEELERIPRFSEAMAKAE
jgi:ribosomal protein L22